MMNADVQRLHEYARTGDAETFSALVDAYQDLVYGACLRVLGNAADAEDAAQDCFIELARKAARVRSSLGAWLHRRATHHCLNLIKQAAARRKREREYGRRQASERETMHDQTSWQDVAPEIDRALNELPDELRQILVEHFLRRRSQDEIAGDIGVSPATVSRRVNAGVEKLRESLKKAGVIVPAAALATLLAQKAAVAAPATLSASLGKMALAGVGQAGEAAVAGKAAAIGIGMGAAKAKVIAIAAAAVIASVVGGAVVYQASSGRKADDRAQETASMASLEPAARTLTEPETKIAAAKLEPQALRNAGTAEEPQTASAPPPSVADKPEADWKMEIRKQLEMRVSFEFVETPLHEALRFLQDLADANIILDQQVMESGAGDTPINLKIGDMSLELALRRILLPADLTYTLRDDSVFIHAIGAKLAPPPPAEVVKPQTAWEPALWHVSTYSTVSNAWFSKEGRIIAKPNGLRGRIGSIQRYSYIIVLKCKGRPKPLADRVRLSIYARDTAKPLRVKIEATANEFLDAEGHLRIVRGIVVDRRPDTAEFHLEVPVMSGKGQDFPLVALPASAKPKITYILRREENKAGLKGTKYTLRGPKSQLLSSHPVAKTVQGQEILCLRKSKGWIKSGEAILQDWIVPNTKPDQIKELVLRPLEKKKIVLRNVALQPTGLSVAAAIAPPPSVAVKPQAAWKIEIRKQLNKKVTFEFVEMPLHEVFRSLQDLANVNVIVDWKVFGTSRDVEMPITLRVTDMRLELALNWILRQADLKYTLRDDSVFIHAIGAKLAPPWSPSVVVKPQTAWEIEIREKLEKQVTFEFVETPLVEAIRFLQKLGDVTMILDPKAFETSGDPLIPITLRVTNMRLWRALDWVLRLADLNYTLRNESVFIHAPGAKFPPPPSSVAAKPQTAEEKAIHKQLQKRVSFRFINAPLFEAIAFLQTLSGVTMVLDSRIGNAQTKKTSFRITNRSLEVALSRIMKTLNLAYTIKDSAVVIHPQGVEPEMPPPPTPPAPEAEEVF